jgi:carbonic anhydrase
MGMQGLKSLFGGSRRTAREEALRAWSPRPRLSGRPTPDQALAWLRDGNAAFVASGAPIGPHAAHEVAELARGQSPIAVVVGCSDSRVSPEILFNCRLGDLFVVRVAGATVDPVALGSIEYGIQHLNAPLVVVLGHSGCGAVSAAAKVVTEGATMDGPVEEVVLPILPSVLKAHAAKANDLVTASTLEHVGKMVRRLKTTPAISGPLGQGRLKIIGGFYDLATGRVDLTA